MEHQSGRTQHSALTERSGWRLSKIDVRSPIRAEAGFTVRVELHHPARGRVTDVASGRGVLQAAFAAAARVVGVSPSLQSHEVRTHPHCPGSDPLFEVSIAVTLDGELRSGASLGHDLCRTSIGAWLSAIAAD